MRNQPANSDHSQNVGANLLDVPVAGHGADQAAGPVVRNQFYGVGVIDAQPFLDRFLLVVVALDELAAAAVADAESLRRIADGVIRRLAANLRAAPAPAESADNF